MSTTTTIPPLKLITAVTDEKGRLINEETGHLLYFEPNSAVRLLVDPDQVGEVSTRTMPVLRSGDILHFDLLGLLGGSARVTLKLLTDISMFKQEGYPPYLPASTSCVVESVTLADGTTPPDFEPYRAVSIGKAYAWASKRYQPERASHTTDIYKYVRTAEGVSLRKLWKHNQSDFHGTR